VPFVGEHAARQKSPSQFIEGSIRRVTDNMPSGVALLIGENENTRLQEVQSIRFDADLWTPTKSKNWLKENEYESDSFEEAKEEVEKKTPKSWEAKPSERRTGSAANKPDSATRQGAKEIKVSEAVEESLRNKVAEHNKKHGEKKGRKVNFRTLAAVYRRGAGAFSTSHRPGMTRNQWSMGRVNAFLHLVATGKPKNKNYTTDNDLLPLQHPRSVKKGRYDHIDFRPPQSVADNAAKGLEYRQMAKPSQRGGLTTEEAGQAGIGSGVQRAVNLKNRDNVTPDTVGRMVSFFARHKKNAQIDEDKRGKPWTDAGYVAWLLWGGTAGETWANKIKRQMEAADVKKAWQVSVPISKLSTEKRLAFGWASVIAEEDGTPVVDHQEDRISVQELERAAYDYVQNSRESTEMHERKGVAELVESCVLTPEKREALGMPSGKTGWWIGFRVNDDDVWQKVKDGTYSEFSIGGSAKRKRAQA